MHTAPPELFARRQMTLSAERKSLGVCGFPARVDHHHEITLGDQSGLQRAGALDDLRLRYARNQVA